ncbi:MULTISPECIES: RecQ family ATP-dependent DNA helicase [unclassified Enterococcus]|jgi:ATP-dependent DNA helicase RecQ|uniref:RecQ family ATP-dependent DNA helicase n=1 Tax=unclassified Enterococcus TaxID=2608891 RepID=UPI003D280059
MERLKQALHHYFGYDSFRPGQEEIIDSLINDQDVSAILPTGMGKSLCYQLSGYLKEGIVVIVSPLLSLMEDQVLQLQKQGEKHVVAYNSLLSTSEKRYVQKHLSAYKFLFLSPEMLLQSDILRALKQQKIALFVVDEAHCVSQWGVDFRPEYQRLGESIALLGQPTTLALTATATPRVQKDIETVLFSEKPKVVKHSVNRENIALFVQETNQKETELRTILSQTKGAAIVYCATKKTVEAVYEQLRPYFAAGYYHGGLDASQRRQLQQQFNSNQLQVLVATNAFGMGINKPDIRLVVHYDLPDSLENYVQEIGRAGRDQQPSSAILLYQEGDERIHWFFNQLSREQRQSFEFYLEHLKGEDAPFDELQKKWWAITQQTDTSSWLDKLRANEKENQQRLEQMIRYIEETNCRRTFIMDYFGETLQEKPEQCCDLDGAKRSTERQEAEKKKETEDWEVILINLFKKKNPN